MGDHKLARTKIIIITDAWDPQVNGVVTTYKNIIANLPDSVSVDVIHPRTFNTLPFTLYKGIDIPLCSYNNMARVLGEHKLEYNKQGYNVYFHIATEGVLGFQAKRYLDNNNIVYTTAYHTKFPEFLKEIYSIPTPFTKWYFDWFHKKAKFVMCSSKSSAGENINWNSVVLDKGYKNYFKPAQCKPTSPIILLYVGRVSKEKNIDEFCKLDISDWVEPHKEIVKIVVGDGPYKQKLKSKYPNVKFVGYKFNEELASYYQMANVMVFPSRVDTFGIVILEAMACGTPVAAYPVTGPIDQIENGVNGWVDQDLSYATGICLEIDRNMVAASVRDISWQQSAQDFLHMVTC